MVTAKMLRMERMRVQRLLRETKNLRRDKQKLAEDRRKLNKEIALIQDLAKNGVRTKIRRAIKVAKSPEAKKAARIAGKLFGRLAKGLSRL